MQRVPLALQLTEYEGRRPRTNYYDTYSNDESVVICGLRLTLDVAHTCFGIGIRHMLGCRECEPFAHFHMLPLYFPFFLPTKLESITFFVTPGDASMERQPG